MRRRRPQPETIGKNVGLYLDAVSTEALAARAKAVGLSPDKLAARIVKREIADPRDAMASRATQRAVDRGGFADD